MIRASASQSVDLGFIFQVESYQKTLKMIFTASLLGTQQNGDNVEDKPASLLVVSLGKTLNGMPHLYVEDRWWSQAVYPSWSPSLTEDLQTERER